MRVNCGLFTSASRIHKVSPFILGGRDKSTGRKPRSGGGDGWPPRVCKAVASVAGRVWIRYAVGCGSTAQSLFIVCTESCVMTHEYRLILTFNMANGMIAKTVDVTSEAWGYPKPEEKTLTSTGKEQNSKCILEPAKCERRRTQSNQGDLETNPGP